MPSTAATKPPRDRPKVACIYSFFAIFTGVVKNLIEVNYSPELEAEAIRVLRSIPELAVSLPPRQRDCGTDAIVRYADTEVPVAVEVRARLTSAAAHLIAHHARARMMPVVVIATESTAQAREILTEAGVGLVDGLGNVRLELPGLLVRIASKRPVRRAAVPVRLSGKSGLVAQAMLCDVDRSWQVGDLKQRCGVSAGLVHRVLLRLEHEGVVEVQGAGPAKTRRLSNPAALLDLWVEEQIDRPTRHPLFMLAQTTDQLISRLSEGLEAARVDYALTGTAAAARLAPFLTNVAVSDVWLDSTADPSAVCAHLGATPVDSGPNVVLLQDRDNGPLAFRNRIDGVWTTNLFRLYLDTRRDRRRGREQSDHLRREVIGF